MQHDLSLPRGALDCGLPCLSVGGNDSSLDCKQASKTKRQEIFVAFRPTGEGRSSVRAWIRCPSASVGRTVCLPAPPSLRGSDPQSSFLLSKGENEREERRGEERPVEREGGRGH